MNASPAGSALTGKAAPRIGRPFGQKVGKEIATPETSQRSCTTLKRYPFVARATECTVPSFGFPPISSPSARVLILGSLPGRLSLERGEYYANPQNAFWKIVAARVPKLPSDYSGRAAVLIKHGVALWDVLAAATRSGSLDAAIAEDAIANNFRAFFHVHSRIRLIAFNGGSAARLYERHVLPT